MVARSRADWSSSPPGIGSMDTNDTSRSGVSARLQIRNAVSSSTRAPGRVPIAQVTSRMRRFF
ncbi:Uncharacterised protein [Mycobacteroides abscessus subsp. bolletii]|nr:Uncharacterised protein [Mycobacteroides abscessus subsp. bolletii]